MRPCILPTPTPLFFLLFSGAHRVPGEMEGVGHQVSAVGVQGQGGRGGDTRPFFFPWGVRMFAPSHVPLWFSFLFCACATRQVQYLGARREHPGLAAYCSLRAEVSLGSWQGHQGRGLAGAPRGETGEPGRTARSGAREGALFNLWCFSTAGRGSVSCMGPRRGDPNPKLSS